MKFRDTLRRYIEGADEYYDAVNIKTALKIACLVEEHKLTHEHLKASYVTLDSESEDFQKPDHVFYNIYNHLVRTIHRSERLNELE